MAYDVELANRIRHVVEDEGDLASANEGIAALQKQDDRSCRSMAAGT